jgi:hypothetical protein
MTEANLDLLYDVQDDDLAQHMAGFTNPDGCDRGSYVASSAGTSRTTRSPTR